MKVSHTPPAKLLPVDSVKNKPPLMLLNEAAQAGWIPVPVETQTYVDHPRPHPSRWVCTMSVPGFPPGVGVERTRAAARSEAAARLAVHVRPVVNVCPDTGRDMYGTREAALDAIAEQQVFGLGKPLVREFRCPACEGWHASGSGAPSRRKKRKQNRTSPPRPWGARPLMHEVVAAPTGEMVGIVTAEIGMSAPDGHVGQIVAVVLRRQQLAELLEELDGHE
jgi:hypothetical protein